MKIKEATFVASYPRESSCPPAEQAVPEFAFIGRSNVGKSSLINMLTGRKHLAKVSGTPGKTQLLNYFHINNTWYLVDLPGYGYAKLAKFKREKLAKMIDGYLLNRPTLYLAFVLIDSNIPPKQVDLDFIDGLGEQGIPFALVFTKCDKQSKGKVQKSIGVFLDKLSETWETLPPYFISSSMHNTGREEILDYIQNILDTH
ncbi:MAG: ribosome biogenesis GTP-binding protein YihA/YsxC [Saprospiraceae bacterium]|jgi:GTP-binding protein